MLFGTASVLLLFFFIAMVHVAYIYKMKYQNIYDDDDDDDDDDGNDNDDDDDDGNDDDD